ncbi:Hypothetical protein FKW44_017647, partial [Caligus rogercresseyi]
KKNVDVKKLQKSEDVKNWRQLKKKQNVDVKKKNVYVKKKNVNVKKKNINVKKKNVDVKN